ncbi:glycosyltransferase family 2 protein [Mesorhizobium sp. ANAO-SY3R2]|uniref:glycosyltransferase family 2 protein n=1 Tax=Mesorhizobium sp. ANAO-SY3R2 TaxID=3166644 RepID=UPI003672C7E2
MQHIVIAVLTYRRPDTLAQLLRAVALLDPVQGAKATLLVIDNDAEQSARELVNSAGLTTIDVKYVVELSRGIPIARNRALNEAGVLGADFLCFIDDDEYPARDWLTKLMHTQHSTGAHLVGGPVRVAPAGNSVGWWKSCVNSSLACRALRKEAKTAKAALARKKYTIVTNNWLADLRWLANRNIRFDERHRYSGGSDTAFFRTCLRNGCIVAWSSEAIVYETILPERLSLAYQYRRGMAQSTNHFHMKTEGRKSGSMFMTVGVALMRAALGVVLLVLPVYGRASPVSAVRSIGWGMGRLNALRGGRSNLYG